MLLRAAQVRHDMIPLIVEVRQTAGRLLAQEDRPDPDLYARRLEYIEKDLIIAMTAMSKVTLALAKLEVGQWDDDPPDKGFSLMWDTDLYLRTYVTEYLPSILQELQDKAEAADE